MVLATWLRCFAVPVTGRAAICCYDFAVKGLCLVWALTVSLVVDAEGSFGFGLLAAVVGSLVVDEVFIF